MRDWLIQLVAAVVAALVVAIWFVQPLPGG